MLHCNYFIPNCSTTTHQRAQLNLGGYSRSSQVTSMVQTPNTNPAEELCMHSKSMMSKIKHIVWPQVILFGDSITQFSFQANGWGAEIADKLARKCDVVNRGLSGYNTRWAKIVLPRLIPSAVSSHLAAVTVFFGANDCALEDKNPQQHVPLQEYSENLKDIAQYLTSIGVPKEKVIFITPPPLHDADWEKQCLLKGCALNRTNAVAGQYAQACVKSAGQCGAEVLDLWTLMQKDGQDITVYLSDGLHLSEKGNQFVAQHLWRLLETRVNHLPFILPYWGDVDPKSPESCLLSDGPQGDPSATEGQH